MKTLLLAATAVLALTTAAQAGKLYVSTAGGWNVDGDSSFPGVDEESGMVGMLALGTTIADVPGLRAEIEASFRTHDTNIGPVLTAEHDTTAVMANLAYDFTGMGRIVPYVLVGAGVAQTELTFGGLAPLTIEGSGFAFQAGVGVDYRVSDTIRAGVKYVYLEAPEVELFGTELDGGSNHSLLAGLTIALN